MTYIICILLITLGHAADYFSTVYALAHGGRELNAVVRAIGLVQSKVTGVILTAFVFWFARADSLSLILVTIPIVLALIILAIHNVYVVGGLK